MWKGKTWVSREPIALIEHAKKNFDLPVRSGIDLQSDRVGWVEYSETYPCAAPIEGFANAQSIYVLRACSP